ncbi:MAG: hypothetical protein AABW56_00985 [Nanoarchaeota archaeon]
MNKAQITAQPLYYIFIIIVVALVLLFGFNMIRNLLETQEKSTFIQFKTDIESAIDNVYNANPGTKLTYLFLVPKDTSEVCFEKVSEGTRVRADSIYSQSFLNEKLTHNKANPYCVRVVNKKINVIMENKIIDSKSIVELS